jgi:hypothetical protein
MRFIEVENEEDFVPTLVKLVEEQTGHKIFTLRVLDKNEEGIEIIAALENKAMMIGKITIQPINGKIGARLQANFL